MGSFLRFLPDPPIRIEFPGSTRSGEQYAGYMTAEAQETREVTIRRNGEVVVRVTPDGRIIVKGEEV